MGYEVEIASTVLDLLGAAQKRPGLLRKDLY